MLKIEQHTTAVEVIGQLENSRESLGVELWKAESMGKQELVRVEMRSYGLCSLEES